MPLPIKPAGNIHIPPNCLKKSNIKMPGAAIRSMGAAPGFLFQQFMDKSFRYIHTRGNLSRRHPLLRKTAGNTVQALTHLDDIPVRIINSHCPLPPAMFHHRMDIAYIFQLFQPMYPGIKVVLFKIKLGCAAAIDQIFAGLTDQPGPAFGCLQAHASS